MAGLASLIASAEVNNQTSININHGGNSPVVACKLIVNSEARLDLIESFTPINNNEISIIFTEAVTGTVQIIAVDKASVNVDSRIHEKNKDLFLDQGGSNQTSAAEARSHIDSQANPHNVEASQISDFDTAVSNNSDVSANTSARDQVKVSANDTTSKFLLTALAAGANITITENNDGGNETITISASNSALPQDYEDFESLPVTTTTSTTFTNKLNVTTTTKPVGRYLLFWSYAWNYNSNQNDFIGRILVDGAEVMFHQQEPKDSGGSFESTGSNQRHRASGQVFLDFATQATHTILFQLATSTAGNNASMWEARASIWRVS